MKNISADNGTAPKAQAPTPSSGKVGRYGDPKVLARVALLKAASMPELKAEWRSLFATEPPPYNRRFLESRLGYRIQELAFGGLKPLTVERLRALAEHYDRGDIARSRASAARRPIAGTCLIREWQGIEQTVTVMADGYEWQGRPYQSLSSVARAITGTRWNGWTFFGLTNHRAAKGRG